MIRAGYLALIESRPVVQAIFSLRFLVGGLLGSGAGYMPIVHGLMGQLAWFAATWFTYLLNGLSDLEGDRANKSKRPLATGRLPARSAVAWVIGLGVCSLGFGALVGWIFEAGTIAILLVGWAYSMGRRPLKQSSLSSSAAVGVAGFLTYLCGSLAYHQVIPIEVLEFAGVMSFWMIAAGNSKDFGDEVGDALSRRKSLPLILGRDRAAVVVSVACGVVGALGMLAAASSSRLVPLTVLLPAACTMAVLWSKNRENRERSVERSPYRVFMCSQYVINLGMVAMMLLHPVA